MDLYKSPAIHYKFCCPIQPTQLQIHEKCVISSEINVNYFLGQSQWKDVSNPSCMCIFRQDPATSPP